MEYFENSLIAVMGLMALYVLINDFKNGEDE